MKNGGLIPWNVIVICEAFKTSCRTGKHLVNGDWEKHSVGIIPFRSMIEYHPVSVKDQSILHQFGKQVLPGIFLGYVLDAGGIWRGDNMVADIEELEHWTRQKFMFEDSIRRRSSCRKW